MSIQQGQSVVDAIDVENVTSSTMDIVYGYEWQQVITGKQLIKTRFPKVLVKGIVKIIFEKTMVSLKYPVIYCGDMCFLHLLRVKIAQVYKN